MRKVKETYIIRMPSNTCYRGIMLLSNEFANPPKKEETGVNAFASKCKGETSQYDLRDKLNI